MTTDSRLSRHKTKVIVSIGQKTLNRTLHTMPFQGILGHICETPRREIVEIEWKLENFSLLSEQMDDSYYSPPFTILRRYFYLKLYPNGSNIKSKGWISIYLLLRETSCPTMEVLCSLSIKKADGKAEHIQSFTHNFTKGGLGWGIDKALERAELLRSRQELVSSDTLTITATLKSGVLPPVEDSDIPTVGKLREGINCTQFSKEVFWKIDDAFRQLDKNGHLSCWSPKYAFGTQEGKMRLSINEDRTEIDLFMSSSTAGYLSWRAGIFRADGKEQWTGNGQTLLQEDRPDRDPFGAWFGPPRNELIRQKVALIPGGVLTFFVQINTQKDMEGVTGMSVMKIDRIGLAESRSEERQQAEITGLTTLSRSLKDLYVAGKDCDVSLKVKEKTFSAHRVILGARTPVLAAMFSHNMAESETGVVRVEDCHPEAFQVFLLFVYSGVAENLTSENVPNVYYIADKYDLPALKEVCVRYMLSTLTVESVCSILALSSRHGEEELLKEAKEFFVKNAREIYRTAAWPNFLMENITLANELIIQSHENVK